MSEITVAALRIAFVVLLWLFVFSVVAVLRSDLFGTGVVARRRTGRAARSESERRKRGAATDTPSRGIPPVSETQHVIVVTEGSLRGTMLKLQHVPILIGRSSECALVLDDEYASNRHARIFKGAPEVSEWMVEDLGSTNGSTLNGQPLTAAVPFQPGSVLRIGQSSIEMRKGPR
ncbi:FHA domain-containing protein [Micrococcales bacterium 31B]|nr:FHA domain-containing protein [Micrococcales bacterium 31B]